MSIDITDGLLDLSTEAGRLANSEAYKEAMTGAFKELNIVKAVGNKVKTTLLNCLCEEANPSIHYTAYDICIELMRLPERVGSIPSLEPLQNAVGKAPYVKYESLLLTVTA